MLWLYNRLPRRFLSLLAPWLVRVLRSRLPKVGGIPLVLCQGTEADGHKIQQSLQALGLMSPTRLSWARSYLGLVHVDAQPHSHGKYEPRMNTCFLDLASLREEPVAALAQRIAFSAGCAKANYLCPRLARTQPERVTRVGEAASRIIKRRIEIIAANRRLTSA